MDSDRSPERPLDLDGIAADLDGVEVALERLAAGTYWNDEATGEAVVAYVVPSGSRLSADELEDVVRRHCADRLARFKRPSVVEVVDQLPYTATGKVQKGRLRAEARRRDPGLLR